MEIGLIVGLLIGEGHFGGDGRQPHILLRMHSRHLPLFKWLLTQVPGSKLYGPYNHGGRNYCQWMVRGEPLRQFWPQIEPLLRVDPHTQSRLAKMVADYDLGASSNSRRTTSSTEIS